jgi:hypothetical protein
MNAASASARSKPDEDDLCYGCASLLALVRGRMKAVKPEAEERWPAMAKPWNAGEAGFVPDRWGMVVAALLLTSQADVNAKDSKGKTPLHHSAKRGRSDVAEVLLANGAEVTIEITMVLRLCTSRRATP